MLELDLMKESLMLATKSRYITFALVALLATQTVTPVYAQSVVVFGSLDQAISWLESEDWWGEEKRHRGNDRGTLG